MREIVHVQAGQCGNQIGAKVSFCFTVENPGENLILHAKFDVIYCTEDAAAMRYGCDVYFLVSHA